MTTAVQPRQSLARTGRRSPARASSPRENFASRGRALPGQRRDLWHLAPDASGYQFPPLAQVARDFRQMADLGINTVRTYTPPDADLLDEAARCGLRVMVGLPWSQHVAFLDNTR